jgi:hypothetical protein
MNSSLEERRRRFRLLAETHPGLVVASTLVEDVRINARAGRRIAPLRRKGCKKSDIPRREILDNAALTPRPDGDPVMGHENRGEDPARKSPAQLQFSLWSEPQAER